MKRKSSQGRFRTGKIARLPHPIREQLNRLLLDGRWEKDILPWLNGLPDVRAIVDGIYGGEPISKQNLSNWRRGGFRDWLAQQQALEAVRLLGANAKELDEAASGQLAEQVGICMTARVALELNGLALSRAPASEKSRKFRELCNRHVALWRADQNAKWIRLESERLKFDQNMANDKAWSMPYTLDTGRNGEVKFKLHGHFTKESGPEDLLRMVYRAQNSPASGSKGDGTGG